MKPPGRASEAGPPSYHARSYMKRLLIQNVSGNEVYYTACSLLVVLNDRAVNFIARKFQIETHFIQGPPGVPRQIPAVVLWREEPYGGL